MNTLPPEYYEQAKRDLEKLAAMTMPFGKYAGRRIIDLPENYLLWFRQKGFPAGELGRFMQIALEMKVNGCDQLLRMPRKESRILSIEKDTEKDVRSRPLLSNARTPNGCVLRV